MEYFKVDRKRGKILNDFMLEVMQVDSLRWDMLIKDYNQSQARLMESKTTKSEKEKAFVYNSLLKTLDISQDSRYSKEFRYAHESNGINYDLYLEEVKQIAIDYEDILTE